MHQSDRLFRRAAVRPGDAGDGDARSHRRMRQHAPRHRFGGLAADRAITVQRAADDAEHVLLGLVGIGDEAAVEHAGDAGNFGERAGHQPAGAGFRRSRP